MKYKTLFNAIHPPKTDDEMIRSVLSGKDKPVPAYAVTAAKKHRFRTPAVIAAAALAASVVISAAGAYCGWDYSRMFDGFFSRIAEESGDYVDTGIGAQISAADLSQMGTDLDKTVDFGCGTVTFTGAVADSNTVMLMYDITVDDDILLEYQEKYGGGNNVLARIWFENNPTGCNFADGFGTGNSWTTVLFYQDGYLSRDSVLELEFDTLTLWSGDNFPWEIDTEEPVTLSLSLGFMNTQRVALSPEAETTLDNYQYTIEDVIITPLSIQWYARRGEKSGKLQGETDPLIFRFKDGTEVRNYQITAASEYNGGREFFAAMFDKSIDVEDLASVMIGDCTIMLNGE